MISLPLHDGQEIKLGNYIYTYEKVDGFDTLKRYNKKHKRWIILKFSNEESRVQEELLEILSDEYLRQVALEL